MDENVKISQKFPNFPNRGRVWQYFEAPHIRGVYDHNVHFQEFVEKRFLPLISKHHKPTNELF